MQLPDNYLFDEQFAAAIFATIMLVFRTALIAATATVVVVFVLRFMGEQGWML